MKAPLVVAFLASSALLAQSQGPAGGISGQVVDSLSGAPIRKALVQLTHPDFRLTAESDSEGRYSFTGLPMGSYRLEASRSGFHEQRSRQHLPLAAGAQAIHPPFRLAPLAAIAGRILDEDGEPASGATVMLHRFEYRPGRGRWARVQGASTSETGEFRFAQLSPGRYIVEAYSNRPSVNSHYSPAGAPVRPYLMSYYPNAARMDGAVPIVVDLGQEVRGIDVQLTRTTLPAPVTVRGRATLPGATASTRISVSLNRDANEQGPPNSASAVADFPDFRFELSTTPGRYRLAANVYSGAPPAFAADEIDITGPIDNLVVPLAPGPRVSAQLAVRQGGPAAFGEVAIRLWPLAREGNVALIRSDATGRFGGEFEQPFRPGAFSLEVEPESLPEGHYFHSLRFNGEEVSADAFELRTPGRLDIVLSRNAAAVSGTAFSSGQTPLPETLLVLVPQDDPVRATARRTRAGGRFAFTNLPPGKYQILFWDLPGNDLWRDPEFRARHQKHTTEIELAPNANLTLILQGAEPERP